MFSRYEPLLIYSNGHTSTLRIPFDTKAHARVVEQSLSPDKELKPDQISKTLSVEGHELVAEFHAVSDRVLRVTVNSLLDSVALLIESIEELEGL